eukprot:698105-Karenia_brevis.AAC.1
MESFQLLYDNKPQEAAAFLVQTGKSIHQTALDGGSWSNAVLLIPSSDPLGEPSFGGQETKLRAVHQHKKSLRELKDHHK